MRGRGGAGARAALPGTVAGVLAIHFALFDCDWLRFSSRGREYCRLGRSKGFVDGGRKIFGKGISILASKAYDPQRCLDTPPFEPGIRIKPRGCRKQLDLQFMLRTIADYYNYSTYFTK